MNKAGRPPGQTGQAKVITQTELKQILQTIRGGKHPNRNCLVVVLSNYLGLRSKELASLKIKDVYDNDKPKDTLKLIAAYTKGGKHRDVSLENVTVSRHIKAYIAERKEKDGLAFNPEAPLFRSQKGTAFSPNAMVRLIGDIYSSAGIKDASSHTGRRSLITNLAYKGFDLNSIRQIAGHKSIMTTQRYVQDNPQRIADILKAV